jgi:hypothetical protein
VIKIKTRNVLHDMMSFAVIATQATAHNTQPRTLCRLDLPVVIPFFLVLVLVGVNNDIVVTQGVWVSAVLLDSLI